MLEICELGAADDLAGLIDINESPGAFARIHGIFVSLAQEMQFGQALGQIVEVLRVAASLVIVEADRADILIAAPDRFLFTRAAILGCADFQQGHGQRDQHHDRHQREEKCKT